MKPSEIFAKGDEAKRIEKIRAKHATYDLSDEKTCKQHSMFLLGAIFQDRLFKRKPLARKVRQAIHALYEENKLYCPSLLIAPSILDHVEKEVEERDARREEADVAVKKLFFTLTAFDDRDGMQVRLVDLISREHVLQVIEVLFDDIFRYTRNELILNVRDTGAKPVLPHDFKGTPAEMVDTYLKKTPFLDFLMTTVPFHIDDTSRFSHCWILGSSGSGKTQLLEKMIVDDLAREDRPAIIVIDPKGTMIDRIGRLSAIGDRLIVLDPAKHPPALNIFAQKVRGRNNSERQQIANNLILLFAYIFDANDASDKLTARMLNAFSYSCRLMMAMPGATIQTLLDFFGEDPKKTTYESTKFRPYIEKLSPTTRRFFEEQFFTSYGETKKLIADRIFGMMQYPIFEDMFTASECEVDMLDVLQEGKVLLVSSPISLLGKAGSSLFSRLIVAMVTNAALSRVTVPKNTWRPAFLYIDEAQTVYDETKTQELFQLIREFRVGAIVANQQIKGQLSEALYSTLSSNTGIKYCATRSYDDARKMSSDMRCQPEFILDQKIWDGHAHFALYVDGKTPHPLSVAVELGGIDKQPMLSWEEYRARLNKPEVTVESQDTGNHGKTHDAAAEEAAASHDTMRSATSVADVPSVPDTEDGCEW